MRAPKSGILAGAIILVAALVGALPAAAATTTAWATWQPLTGTGGAYTTTVQVAAQPALTATMTSDSRGSGRCHLGCIDLAVAGHPCR
ncbi:hypothetical protein [Microbacterium sp. WCS2018Hpa-9]|uniref:hypothetical protein n=1 Tax=Microbacterium sp. WCS2018Hpa-9 TaxID=3073635 RepID=UPI00288923C3|nr:hypothetical protein [Microbacterium sp. WCS2018Hpa-9]